MGRGRVSTRRRVELREHLASVVFAHRRAVLLRYARHGRKLAARSEPLLELRKLGVGNFGARQTDAGKIEGCLSSGIGAREIGAVARQHESAAQLATYRRLVHRCAAIGAGGFKSSAAGEKQHGHSVVPELQPGVERRVAALGAAVFAIVDGVHVGAVIKQPRGHLDVAFCCRKVQQRLALQAHIEVGAASREHIEDGQRVRGNLDCIVNEVASLPRVTPSAGHIVGPRLETLVRLRVDLCVDVDRIAFQRSLQSLDVARAHRANDILRRALPEAIGGQGEDAERDGAKEPDAHDRRSVAARPAQDCQAPLLARP